MKKSVLFLMVFALTADSYGQSPRERFLLGEIGSVETSFISKGVNDSVHVDYMVLRADTLGYVVEKVFIKPGIIRLVYVFTASNTLFSTQDSALKFIRSDSLFEPEYLQAIFHPSSHH